MPKATGDLARRPSELTAEELGRHRARVFIGQCCVLGPTLVMPLWVLWEAYQAFGEEHGFEAEAGHLRRLLDEVTWADIEERPHARGRLKSIIKGVGMRPLVSVSKT